MKVLAKFVIILLTLSLSLALTIKPLSTEKPPNYMESYATKASRIVSINLLKSYNDIDSNQVHSPIGITIMLTVLAEAAQGNTYEEFCNVLQYPTNRSYLRQSFKQLLNTYQTRAYGYEPSFQTWLYIYRNFTINEHFKQLLRDYYYVVIKDINYNDYDWNVPNTVFDFDSTTFNSDSTSTTVNSKDVIGFETLKSFKLADKTNANNNDNTVHNSNEDNNEDNNDDGIEANHSHKPDLLTTTASFTTDNYGHEYINKVPSKFDRTINDKQYIESTQIIDVEQEHLMHKKQDFQTDNTKNDFAEDQQTNHTQNCLYVDNVNKKRVTVKSTEQTFDENELNFEENKTTIPVKENEQTNKTKIALEKPVTQLDEATTLNATTKKSTILDEHINDTGTTFTERRLFRKDDITSALSANSITGRATNSKTKILLFNGLYFRGTWSVPFLETQQDEIFYMTKDDIVKVNMMHAKGKFQLGNLPHLNAKVLCLPYENQKYKMLIILPDEIEGLHKLIETIQTNDLQLAKKVMKEQELHVILPKFQFEETSRSESMLKGLGLTRIFSRHEADLGLLSQDKDIHVDEIVQFVNIRVDDTGTTDSAISALDSHRRNAEKEYALFEMNHPFIYMIVDSENDFILVSGKVYSPEFPNDLPVTIEVDFEKS